MYRNHGLCIISLCIHCLSKQENSHFPLRYVLKEKILINSIPPKRAPSIFLLGVVTLRLALASLSLYII